MAPGKPPRKTAYGRIRKSQTSRVGTAKNRYKAGVYHRSPKGSKKTTVGKSKVRYSGGRRTITRSVSTHGRR